MTPPASPPSLDRRDAHVQRLRALIEIVQALSSQSDLEGILQQLTVEAAHLAAAERATLFLLDPELGDVVAHTASGVAFALRMPLTAPGLVTYVARTGDILNVPDAGADPRWNPSVDNQTGFRTRSVLTVPMRDRDGDIIGVMQLLNKREGTFSTEDEDLLLALGGSAAIAIQNARLQSELEQQFASFIDTLTATLDARDPQTAGHSTRVTACAVLLARELRLDEDRVEFIRLAAQLHDIGKIRVPEAILTKPAALTAEERTIMRDHVAWTRELLGRIRFHRRWRDLPAIAAMHHEQPNGEGYPLGLRGDLLPLEARILAVADAFDALTSARYYKDETDAADALATLQRDSLAGRVDADVVTALGHLLGRGALSPAAGRGPAVLNRC